MTSLPLRNLRFLKAVLAGPPVLRPRFYVLPRASLDDWLSSLVTLSLAAPVGFSNFARAALAPSARTVQVPAPGADLWPCPPPTEWRWTGPRPSPRKRKLIAKRVLSSRLLQLIVCALNWQALGHPVQPPPAARLGALLSELQGAMLERLERFVMYFLSAPPVDLEALGRSAGKFRDLLIEPAVCPSGAGHLWSRSYAILCKT